jgi:hypothetical protein
MFKYVSIPVLLSAAVCGLADSTTTVNSDAGYISGSVASSGSWSGIPGAAQTATISYTHNLQSGGQSNTTGAPTEFKAVDSAGNFGPRTFNGDHASLTTGAGTALVSVGGHSYISNPGASGAPTYYQASWTSTTSSTGTASASNGTYDPWMVTWGDLVNILGLHGSETAILYYQTGISGGLGGASGFSLSNGGVGDYSFDASASTGNQLRDFFSIHNNSQSGLQVTFNSYANFAVYLLGANAHDDSATPEDRLIGSVMQIVSAEDLLTLVSTDLNPNGSFKKELDFGIFYTGITLPDSFNPDDPVIGWHTNTTVTGQAVPEPLSVLGLGLGILALAFRKR